MTVWISGNSHTGALKEGLTKLKHQHLDIQIFPFGSGVHERTEFSSLDNDKVTFTNEEYAENLQRFTNKSFFDKTDYWGLCLGTHNARIYRDSFWNNAMPSAIAQPGIRPVSDMLLEAMIESDQRYIRSFMSRLKKVEVPFFVVTCPPPRQDHKCFERGIAHETVAYIDNSARTYLKKWLNTQNVDFVDIPKELVTAEGFLKPEFNSPREKRFHANIQYGIILMRKVIHYLEEKKLW